jgi:hypothetical protein
VTFGVLEIQPFHIRVLGEWGGKTAEDYGEERLKLLLPDDLPVLKEVGGTSGLCQTSCL